MPLTGSRSSRTFRIRSPGARVAADTQAVVEAAGLLLFAHATPGNRPIVA